MKIQVSFWGAAQNGADLRYLWELNGSKILTDGGLHPKGIIVPLSQVRY